MNKMSVMFLFVCLLSVPPVSLVITHTHHVGNIRSNRLNLVHEDIPLKGGEEQ